MRPTPYRRPPHEAGSGTESDEELTQTYRQLKAEMLELGRVNEALKRELAEQKHANSQSRCAKEAQQEAFGFLGQVIDDIPMAFQLMSVQDGYRVAMCNKAAQALYGLTREETLGRTLHDLWPETDADRMHAADLDLVAGGVMQDFPDRSAPIRHRGPIRVHLRKFPLKDASGAVTHILITAEDITERQAAQARLQQSWAHFQSLTRLSSDWYWEIDDQFRFTEVSNTWSDQLKGLAGDFIGKTRWEMDHVNMDDNVWAAHKTQLERHEVFRDFQATRLDEQGQIRCWSISGMPIFDAHRRFTGYRGIGRDITKRVSGLDSQSRTPEPKPASGSVGALGGIV